MQGTNSLDDLIKRAYRLAFFIHGEKAVALQVVSEALAKLETAAAAQDKRLYYIPKSDRSRTKTSAKEPHLLQRLVYAESEPYEREAEKRFLTEEPNEEEMIIHFIKHLVRITLKRNSFYVTLGLSRLLHHYSTAETMELYNVLVQDPDRGRDDYYYRSRKKQLMQELKDRFGEMLRISKGARGEERFVADECADQHAELVAECLRQFTPWNTGCALPERIDPRSEEIEAFVFCGDDPDQEAATEINRFHAVLHPDCYSRLLSSLALPAPADRLSVPHFSMASREENDDAPRPPNSRRPADLDSKELEGIKQRLAAESARRKKFSVASLRVLVDGAERARVEQQDEARLRFEVDETAEVIEVRSNDGGEDLLLATHLLSFDESGAAKNASIILENGRKISFHIAPRLDANTLWQQASVEVAVCETRPHRIFMASLRRLFVAHPLVRPALAFGLLALVTLGVFTFIRNGKSPGTEVVITLPSPTPIQALPSPTPATVEKEIAPAPEPKAPKRESLQPLFSRREDAPAHSDDPIPPVQEPDSTEGLRGVGKQKTKATLAQVRTLYLDPIGVDEAGRIIRNALQTHLKSSSRLRLTDNRDDADAVLKATLNGTTLRVRIVHAQGDVVWPLTGSWKEYKGDAETVAKRLVKDLESGQ